jgi:hypothetical protein
MKAASHRPRRFGQAENASLGNLREVFEDSGEGWTG